LLTGGLLRLISQINLDSRQQNQNQVLIVTNHDILLEISNLNSDNAVYIRSSPISPLRPAVLDVSFAVN